MHLPESKPVQMPKCNSSPHKLALSAEVSPRPKHLDDSLSVETDSGEPTEGTSNEDQEERKVMNQPPIINPKVVQVASICPTKNEVINNDVTVKAMKERKHLDLNRWHCISRP